MVHLDVATLAKRHFSYKGTVPENELYIMVFDIPLMKEDLNTD